MREPPRMLRWVRLSRFCELTGYTEDAVHAKMRKGKWLEGWLWRKAPDGHIMVNLEAFEEWVEGEEFPPASKFGGRASA